MAKTKQTAAQSTGGKVPRQQLAMKAARMPSGGSMARAAGSKVVTHQYVPANRILHTSGDGSSWFEVWSYDGKYTEKIHGPDIASRIDAEITRWCEDHSGRFLTDSIYDRWNLAEWKPSGSGPQVQAAFEPYSVMLDGDRYMADTLDNKGKYFEVVFCSIFANEKSADQARLLDFVDSWCTANPGKSRVLSTLGNNISGSDELPLITIRLDLMIKFRSGTSGCALSAMANLIAPIDTQQAYLIQEAASQLICKSLRVLARWIEINTRWTLRRIKPADRVPAEKLDYVLNQDTGLFLVTPKCAEGFSVHVVGVDAYRKQVLDSSEPYAMTLCREAFERCFDASEVFDGFEDYREVVRKEPAKKKRRGRS
jgi:hypothetical protein